MTSEIIAGILIAIALIIAMACRTLVHNLLHHYYDTDKKFNLDDQWWNPLISWMNKKTIKWTIDILDWRVVKFPIPVQFSDAFHLFNTVELGAYTFAITIPLYLYLGYDWWSFLIIFGVIGLIIILTFNLFYDKIWR